MRATRRVDPRINLRLFFSPFAVIMLLLSPGLQVSGVQSLASPLSTTSSPLATHLGEWRRTTCAILSAQSTSERTVGNSRMESFLNSGSYFEWRHQLQVEDKFPTSLFRSFKLRRRRTFNRRSCERCGASTFAFVIYL